MISLGLIGLVLIFFFVWLWFYEQIKRGISAIFPITKSQNNILNAKKTDGPTATAFQEGWITVNGISSHVLSWGGWVENPLPGDAVLIFMCGVPGITLFYQNFLELLYTQLRIPVWTICIAGHELPPASANKLPKDSKVYNSVEAQVAHKKAFITEFVPNRCKVYFVGHSFGAKMVTELLKDDQIRSRTLKCYLLMPTLERFGDTPRAKFWLMCTNTGIIYTIVMLSWILYCLPLCGRRMFSNLYFHSRGLRNVSSCCVQAMVEFCHPTVFYNVRCLVWNELETITHLDTEVLSDLRDRIKVYFAPQDKWAPLTHCDTLKSAVPGLSVEILDNKFEHAFTLATAEDMAAIIVKDMEVEITHPIKNLKSEELTQSLEVKDLRGVEDCRTKTTESLTSICEWIQ